MGASTVGFFRQFPYAKKVNAFKADHRCVSVQYAANSSTLERVVGALKELPVMTNVATPLEVA